MAKRNFYVDIDLNHNHLIETAFEVLAADPSSPVQGQVYFNSVELLLRQFDGTVWIAVGTGTSSSHWEPVSNGDPDFPEVVFSDGDIVMSWVV